MPPYGYVWLRPGLLPPARRKPCTGKPWSARCDRGRAPVRTWSKRQRCGTAHWLPGAARLMRGPCKRGLHGFALRLPCVAGHVVQPKQKKKCPPGPAATAPPGGHNPSCQVAVGNQPISSCSKSTDTIDLAGAIYIFATILCALGQHTKV